MEELQTSSKTVDMAFSAPEQAAIIACAAALQREDNLKTDLSALERAALEAGIAPRFVREAIRLQGADPAVARIPTLSEPTVFTGRSATLAVILVPAEIMALTWGNDFFLSLWGSVVVAALFSLGLQRQSAARWIAAAWPVFIAISVVVFDNAARLNYRWTVDLILAAIQGAVAWGVYKLASTPHPWMYGTRRLSRQGKA